jgi:calcineurin-like phosphoesterase family protein
MKEAPFPEDLRRFILTSVESVPYLEALLLMRGEAATVWNIGLIARRLYIGEKQTGEIVKALQGAGLIVNKDHDPDNWCYRPASSELASMIDRLADFYAGNLLAVTHLIHSLDKRKAKQFSEAFIWRKD